MSEDLIAAAGALGGRSIGHSWQGRPLHAVRFGPADPAERSGLLVVVAGVHGDEPSSVQAALELCAWLQGHPADQPLLVIPALNPDGIVHGTKNSATDVDLNRNFPARSFTLAHAPRYHPGPRPLSEPETRALAAVVEEEPVCGVVAVHAPFACINYDGPARGWAEAVSAACGWPVQEDIGYPTPGSLGSWLGRDRALPVLTIELPAGPYENFRAPAQIALQTAINPERIR